MKTSFTPSVFWLPAFYFFRNLAQILILLLFCLCLSPFAQAQTIEWDKTFGGSGNDKLSTVQPTSDGGYILGGSSSSGISGEKSEPNRGGNDYWMVKTDAQGQKIWDKTFGSAGDDFLNVVQQTQDGGYILGGYSSSDKSGDKSQDGNGGADEWGLIANDFWIIKVNSQGSKEWDKTIGGIGEDQLQTIYQTKDGGYLLGGTSFAGISGDKSQSSKGNSDYWIVKINASGQKEWDQAFGGDRFEYLAELQPTADGGYILGGNSSSDKGGDKSEPNRINREKYKETHDYWIVKLSATGQKEWDRTYGGEVSEFLTALQPTRDGGYILGGTSNSGKTGDKSEGVKSTCRYSYCKLNYWVVKLNSTGNKEWDKTLGGNYSEYLTALQQTSSGGYLIGGYSESDQGGDKSDSNKIGNKGYNYNDYWVVTLDAQGNKLADKTIGGTNYDELAAIINTPDGGFLLGGYSHSGISGDKTEPNRDPDFTTNTNAYDYWIVKIDNGIKKDQNLVFDTISYKTHLDSPFTLSAKASTGLPVTFSIVSGPATVKNNVVTLTGKNGLVTVKATQTGNTTYNSVSITQTFYVYLPAPITKQWDQFLGGSADDGLATLIATPDGGYLLGGNSSSGISGTKSEPNRGRSDYWIIKVDVNGQKVWDKTFGGADSEYLKALVATPDGGYLLGGTSESGISGDKTEDRKGEPDEFGYPDSDYWVIKIDAKGNKIWDKTLGGDFGESLTSVAAAPDGSLLLSGLSYSGISDDKTEDRQGCNPEYPDYICYNDVWVVKLDRDGNKLWDRTLGYKEGDDNPTFLLATPDNQFLLGGTYNGYWLLKLDTNGQQVWEKRYFAGILQKVITTFDGGFLLGGWSGHSITQDKSEPVIGDPFWEYPDYWVVKIDVNGNKIWDKTLGGTSEDVLISMAETPDHGFLLGGTSSSKRGADKSEDSNYEDMWLIKINGTNGQKEWDKTFVNGGKYAFRDVIVTREGDYLIGGAFIPQQPTNEIEKGSNYWIIKLKEFQTSSLASFWNLRYGGNGTDNLTSTIKTQDGGYLSGGYTNSGISGDKTQISQGKNDYWIVKCDKNGKKLWDKRYGGSNDDYLNRVLQTQDGGYLLAGSSLSGKSGDKTEVSKGDRDYWIIKTDAQGNKQWDKTFGGSGEEELVKVIQLSTGEYVLGGYSNSPVSGDKTQASQGSSDYWILKISSTGTLIWDQRYGGGAAETLGSFIQTTDGGFLLGGSSLSGKSGDKSQVSQGGSDYWVVKTDKQGTLVWEKTFGGNSADEAYSVGMNSDNNYFISGTSSSGKSGNKTQASQGGKDFWLVTLDEKGTKLWDRTFGGSKDDELRASTYTHQGHYVLAGHSYSDISGDKTQDSQGESDYWAVVVDENGNKVQDLRFGGSGKEELRTVTQTKDGGILLAGRSSSGVSGDRTQPSQGSTDYWLVKVAPQTSPILAARQATVTAEPVSKTAFLNLQAYPNPFQEKVTISFTLPDTQMVTVKVLDSQGKAIATLFQEDANANQTYQVEWQAGKQESGLYFLRLQTAGKVQHQKVLLTK
ncbi:T9SS type A sorting domain-containing protein [Adhaeribacter pallidiroseus]|uniref:Secretion system C-terminal sorting domain-containing protein n=1 Tax=Adhaeribacter pallidiroseus TaxID=2072847 RepID=A0A369QIZ5_9BACT|nr:T9SS type A sorting domain-containing protein [Adhaeribacter pallidiroseus]RDC64881.1 hypothetical protein AHMF7616_03503 [Adhaeribacter pallidiroseus]